MILFLDDSKEHIKSFKRKVPSATTVMTAQDCINKLSIPDSEWDIVFLDHDLGGEVYVDSNREDCGMEVVRWIIENEPFIRQIIIHSLNTPAALEMRDKLRQARYQTICIPFTDLIHKVKEL